MQKVIVFVIVFIAVFIVGRRLYRTFKKTGAEGCGCDNCQVKSSCTIDLKKKKDGEHES